MIQRTGPHGGREVRMSHLPFSFYPFIIWTDCRWEQEVDFVKNLSLFCCSTHNNEASIAQYVKITQAPIWHRVMEGCLNSPSEILEPVGKPQLFKCRKSWFYKMLIWYTLGTGKPTDPPFHPVNTLCWREGAKGGGGGGGVTQGENETLV